MPYKAFSFRPGVNRENTAYSNEGGWYACDKVRFRNGSPESIGGWQLYGGLTYLGTCRQMLAWTTLANDSVLALGTNLKVYLERGQALYDITPIRLTGTAPNNPFATTNGTNSVVVSYPNHGAIDGDFVTFSGATGFAGLAAGDLNREFQIGYIDANTFRITVGVNANATTTGGGAAVSCAFQINTGPANAIIGNGWGAGAWGLGGWGQAAATATVAGMRLWSMDNFGEVLMFAPRGGPLYFWTPASGFSTRGVNISTVALTDYPRYALWLLVSPSDRHLMVFGTNGTGTNTPDPLLVRWCSQEDFTTWTPSIENTAGEFRLESGSYIVTAKKSRQEILAWTDSALYSITFVGAPEVFGRQQVADNISIASPSAAIFVNGVMYWMGVDKFYQYTGRLETLPCSLQDYVFSDINRNQLDQVFAASNEGFNEVWWFYCSAESTDVDRYVAYNYVDRAWTYGTMHRTFWLDTSLKQFPLAVALGKIYNQEFGIDDGSVDPAVAMNSWIESSPFDLDDGHHFLQVTKLLPDITFNRSTAVNPGVTFTFNPSPAPGANYQGADTTQATATRTATVPIEQYTPTGYMRLRGRQVVMRVENTQAGTAWRLGTIRLDVRPSGRR